jgi:phage terminase small subunit
MAEKSELRRAVFIREYLVDFNGQRAAVAAGYAEKSARVTASHLLDRPEIRDAIAREAEKKTKKLDITVERVLEELGRMGFANMLDYVTVQEKGSAFVDLSQLTREQAAAIQEITVDEYTEGRGETARDVKRTKFKLGDKRGSLELLGKYLKLFTDKFEHSGPGGGPIQHDIDFNKLSDQQIIDLQRIAESSAVQAPAESRSHQG